MAENLSKRIFHASFFRESIMGGVVFTPTRESMMAYGIYVESYVRGYHTNQDIWDAAVGEELLVRKIGS